MHSIYAVTFWIFFTINISRIGAYFIYFSEYLKKMFTRELKLRLLTIIIRSIFSEDGKFYPQLFLDLALYEL